jgi:hypothetical protein
VSRPSTADHIDASHSLLVPVDTVGGRAGRGARRRSRALAFLAGLLLGLLGGAAGLILLLLMAAARQPLLPLASSYSDPDITIGIRERYLNRQANEELRTTHPIVLPFISVTNIELDFQPGNQMRLKPTFHATLVDVSATVMNQVVIENEEIALHMVGDPQIQDIQIPIDWLPFNLAGEIRSAVDRINNELLSAEINRQLAAGFGSDRFRIVDVITTDEYLTVRLQAK